MNVSSFIATTGSDLNRATQSASGAWHVETLLAGQDVRCLAGDCSILAWSMPVRRARACSDLATAARPGSQPAWAAESSRCLRSAQKLPFNLGNIFRTMIALA